MTKDKALQMIKELEAFVAGEEVGYKDDEVFLLSIEEYERYKDVIKEYCADVKGWWWLRSPSYGQYGVALVSVGGSVNRIGGSVSIDRGCVRPAIKCEHDSSFPVGWRTIYRSRFVDQNFADDFTIVKIADGAEYDLYIANLPISYSKFDDDSNDYETSYIRSILNQI